MGRVDLAVLPMEGPGDHRIQIKNAKIVKHLNVNMSKPQDLSKWEHLNDIPPPKIDGEDVMLLFRSKRP